MKLAMVDPTNRDGELVTHSVSKPTPLSKREVMRIRWHAAAHETRLPQHELPVALIAQPNGFAQSRGHSAVRSFFGRRRIFLAVVPVRLASGYEVRVVRRPFKEAIRRTSGGRPVRGLAVADRGKPSLKQFLDNFGIYGCQGVLGSQISLGPDRRLICRTDNC